MNKEERFAQLFLDYYAYVYEFEVHYKDNFKPNVYNMSYDREFFAERIQDDGMAIKVNEGY